MTTEIQMFVKVPLSEVEEWIRSKYTLPEILSDFRIDGENLVLCFTESRESEEQPDLTPAKKRSIRRRSRKKRNRMKTRGWEIIDRITNSKGQRCAIYKPFVDALQNTTLSKEEQKEVVKRILRKNRNRPSETSIQYFLENTLEYLEKTEQVISEKHNS